MRGERKVTCLLGGLASVLLLAGSSAWAARNAVVDVAEVELHKGPTAKSAVLTKLRKGARLTASNYPTEGFYKVRTAQGELGWVKADSLVLGPMPDLKNGGGALFDERSTR